MGRVFPHCSIANPTAVVALVGAAVLLERRVDGEDSVQARDRENPHDVLVAAYDAKSAAVR
jgi:hypothetical protein